MSQVDKTVAFLNRQSYKFYIGLGLAISALATASVVPIRFVCAWLFTKTTSLANPIYASFFAVAIVAFCLTIVFLYTMNISDKRAAKNKPALKDNPCAVAIATAYIATTCAVSVIDCVWWLEDGEYTVITVLNVTMIAVGGVTAVAFGAIFLPLDVSKTDRHNHTNN